MREFTVDGEYIASIDEDNGDWLNQEQEEEILRAVIAKHGQDPVLAVVNKLLPD